ncbi:MAG: SxtJ family membrane protein [Candidatus Hydrogenedentales bacterium]
MDVNVKDKREQRNFGLMMAAALAVLGLIRWWHTGRVEAGWFYVADVFFLLGLLFPRALQPVFAAWMRLALVLNWLVTRVLLTIVWVVILTPIGLFRRVFAEDALKREWRPDADSYWEEPEEQPDDKRRYYHQY